MKRATRLSLAAAAAVALLLAGCARIEVDEGPGPGVRVRDNRAPYAKPRMDAVAVLDRTLRNKIAVEQTNTRRSPTGTLEVWALLRNRTDYPLQVEGRAQFFDLDRVPVEGPSAWQRLALPGNSVATYREFSALTSGIGHYYIELREAR